MEEDRIKINLHEFDNDMESITKGFRDAASEQGWSEERIEEILGPSRGKDVKYLLDVLSTCTEPDYTWHDDEPRDDEFWDGCEDKDDAYKDDFDNEYNVY